MGWIKRWIGNICLILFGIIIALAILEGVLRFTEYRKYSGSVQFRYYYKPDARLGHDIQENHPGLNIHIEGNYYHKIFSNELGCMDEPYNGEKDYILLVGDSFVHCFTPFDDKWGTIIDRTCNYRVLKCGVGAYGTRQELIKAQDIISKAKVPPRLIVVGYYMNDLGNDYLFPESTIVDGFLVTKRKIVDYHTGEIEVRDNSFLEGRAKRYERKMRCSRLDNYTNCSSVFQKSKNWLSENLLVSSKIEHMASVGKSLLRKLRRSFAGDNISKKDKQELQEDIYATDYLGFYSTERLPWLKKAWSDHLDNIKAFKALSDRMGSKLLVVIIPAKFQVYDYLMRDKLIDIDQPIRILHDFLDREGIAYFDLLQPMKAYADLRPKRWLDPEKDLYWRLDGHWNSKGNRLAGFLVSEYILKNNLINVPDKDRKLTEIQEKLKAFQRPLK